MYKIRIVPVSNSYRFYVVNLGVKVVGVKVVDNTLENEEFYLFLTETIISVPDRLGTHHFLSGMILSF